MKQQIRVLTLLPLSLAVASAYAQTDDEYTTLDTSVVSAAGYAQDVREAPASVSVITSEEIKTKPIRDLGTAVGDVPGVDIDTTKMGNARVSIRGFEPNYTLILQDGRRQNFSSAIQDNGFDPTSAFIPPKGMIERIEVLRGPASTVWGTDAVGGVVNIITKKHVDQLTGSVTLEGTFQEHRKEYGDSGAASFFFGVPLIDDQLTLLLRGRYYRHQDTGIMKPDGKNYASHSPSESYNSNVGGRLNWKIDSENEAFVDLDFTRFSGGSMSTRSDSIKSQRWFHKYNVTAGHDGNYDFGRTETYVMWNGLASMKSKSSITSATKPGTLPSESHGSFSHPLKETNTYTFATKAIMPYDFKDYGAMNLTVGFEGNYEDYENPSADDASAKGPFDQTTVAVFAEAEYFINEQWNATAGARAQWSDIFGTNIAPRAYLVYKPAEWISFKGGVAAGYKTPNVKQLVNGYYEGDEPGDRSWGNPDLKPEESWSYELSTTFDLGRAAQITIGAFYTDFKNMIAQQSILSPGYSGLNDKNQVIYDTVDTNYGKVRARGIEVLFKTAKFNGFSFTGGYTLTDSEITEGKVSGDRPWKGDRPNELPRHSLQLRADYQNGPFSAYLKSTSKWDMISYDKRAGITIGEKYDNYTILDLGASYSFWDHHTISLAVNNLLDKDMVKWVDNGRGGVANAYRAYVEGRNFWVSYTYDF